MRLYPTHHLVLFLWKKEEKEHKTWAWSFVLVPKSFIRITWHSWWQAKQFAPPTLPPTFCTPGHKTPKFQDSKFLHWKTYHQNFTVQNQLPFVYAPFPFHHNLESGLEQLTAWPQPVKPATTWAQWRMTDDMWMGDTFPCPITNHNGYVPKPSTSIYVARSQ